MGRVKYVEGVGAMTSAPRENTMATTYERELTLQGPSQYYLELHLGRSPSGRSRGAKLSLHRVAPSGAVFCCGFSPRLPVRDARATVRDYGYPSTEIVEVWE